MKQTFAILLFIALTALGSPLSAQSLTDDIRDQLRVGDFSALEAIFMTAQSDALKSKNFSALRSVYSNLFVTANDERLAKTQEWLKNYPKSPYATSALAWSHYYRAYKARGGAPSRSTSAEAFDAFRNELELAHHYVDEALKLAENFIPAVDAAILLKRPEHSSKDVQSLTARALLIAPDRHTLKLGLAAIQTRWGGTMTDNISLCASLAGTVSDYDAEVCLIEAAFENDVTGILREQALAALDRHTEPFLDYARLDAYLNEWSDREVAASEAVRIHRTMLSPEAPISDYEFYLEKIAAKFQLPFYQIEATDMLVRTMKERLRDNPQSPAVLKVLIENSLNEAWRTGTLENPKLAMSHWVEMLKLGAYQPTTWRIRSDLDALMNGGTDIEQQGKYFQNAIYYSNHNAYYVKNYLAYLFSTYQMSIGEVDISEESNVDLVDLGERVLCPMYRVARVYDFICDYDQSDPGCNVRGWGADFPDRVRRLMQSNDKCPAVREATIEQLVYSPIPVSEFTKEEGQ